MNRITLVACAILLGACVKGGDPADERAPSMHAPKGYEQALIARGITPQSMTATALPDSFATPTYSAAQEARGRHTYQTSCARCHTLAQHTGAAFASRWTNRRVSDLYYLLLNTMPQDAPGTLTEQQYADVVAYLLSQNGFAPGASELAADTAAMRKTRIVKDTTHVAGM